MLRLRLSLPSTALLRPVEIRAAIPYGFGASAPPYRTIWALHCAMEDGDFFFDSLDATSIVNREQVAIIAPSLGNGWFINSSFERQADFLQEMYDAMLGLLPLSPSRENNAVVGLSMGAFGAVRWALQSGLFVSVAAISGVFDCRVPLDPRVMKNRAQRAIHVTFENSMKRFLQNDNNRNNTEADIDIIMKNASKSSLPNIMIYCGEQDYISLPQSMYLNAICKKNGCPVTIHISQGEHDQVYWKKILHEIASNIFLFR